MRLPHDETLKNLGVKVITHTVVLVLYSSTEVDQEKHQQEAKQTRTK